MSKGKHAAASAPPSEMPRIVYIIRHAEKPVSATVPPLGVVLGGSSNIDSLIPLGWQRAGALASLFAPFRKKFRRGLQQPTALMSPAYPDVDVHRTHETILPISQRLTLAINTPAPVGSEATAIKNALASGTNTLLICWEHDHIPALGNALPLAEGVKLPSAWPDDRFDIIWRFQLTAEGRYTFEQIPQQLLSVDKKTVIAVPDAPAGTRTKAHAHHAGGRHSHGKGGTGLR